MRKKYIVYIFFIVLALFTELSVNALVRPNTVTQLLIEKTEIPAKIPKEKIKIVIQLWPL